MKRIQQRGDVDCAVACVAMVLDWTYDQVAACMDDNGIELDINHGISVSKVLSACGFNSSTCEGFYLPNTEPVILILPSNDPDFNHGVVCFNAELIDPSRKPLLRWRSLKKAAATARFTVYDIEAEHGWAS